MGADPDPVVVTVVYDGAAYAGKTTSVRALANGFGRDAVSPQPDEGRTQYYDWFDYVGGRFEGAPIRCQVVSVPGQAELAHRRGYFIERADVVVFVADTTRDAWPETVARLHALRAELARAATPVGLVFQANKRDDEMAVPLAEVEATIGSAQTVIFESVANTGIGVREAFVFAIRLALDRVREAGAGRPGLDHDHGPALVALLDKLARPSDVFTLPALPPLVERSVKAPWNDVLAGFVWPAVEGRILLREAASLAGEKVSVTATDDYYVGLGTGWRVHASARQVFRDAEAARAGLIAWARVHTAASDTLSRGRGLVLSQVAADHWRLWQLVKHVPSLSEEGTADADVLARMAPRCAALGLLCSADTIGIDPESGAAIFVGLVPPLAETTS